MMVMGKKETLDKIADMQRDEDCVVYMAQPDAIRSIAAEAGSGGAERTLEDAFIRLIERAERAACS